MAESSEQVEQKDGLGTVELTRQELEMIRAYAWFAASDATGETNPPNPAKVERWGSLARKMDTALGVMGIESIEATGEVLAQDEEGGR